MNRVTLSRVDIIDVLSELASELHRDHETAHLQIVGGAAMALMLTGDRESTVDVDGVLEPRGAIRRASNRVAEARGLRDDWLNDAAMHFLPSGMGRASEWITILDDDGIRIEVASAETLLAMKVFAAQRRGQREAFDLAVLIRTLGLRDADQVERLYGEFYPGDELTPRTFDLIEQIIRNAPASFTPPEPPLIRIR
ncbi:hypothetical protein [Microbacterium sp. A93]|uniref:hypothetical protein n=1 Tax=Microbacterium sp. A93 TaxID=3450716 RepID=UPI003F440695